jgi:hypothetical protein
MTHQGLRMQGSKQHAVTTQHLAPAEELWRVSVGGDRVEEMTVDQIFRAFQSGELKLRTPLWPPGADGWQALGNFPEFLHDSSRQPAGAAAAKGWDRDVASDASNGYGESAKETDGSPTRLRSPAFEKIAIPGPTAPEYQTLFSARPTQLRSPRQAAEMAIAASPAQLSPAGRLHTGLAHGTPSALPEFRPRRRGVWLLSAAVVLVGLGGTLLGTGGSSKEPSAEVLAKPAPSANSTATQTLAPAPAARTPETSEGASSHAAGPAQPGTLQLVQHDTSPRSAFLAATDVGGPVATQSNGAKLEQPQHDSVATARSTPQKASARKWGRAKPSRARTRTAPAIKATPQTAHAGDPLAPPEPAPAEEVAGTDPAVETANAAAKAAAAKALGEASVLAASCNPRGGPSGTGKARVVYALSGQVQDVEILTEKFRDTVTASCVRMVYRRATIPAFQGERLSFVKTFTIPEK